MLEKQIDLSIIVVAYGIKELIEKCFTAVINSTDNLNKEIIYVDNGSTDDSVEMVREKFPEVIVIESPVNLGFTRANNLGYTKVQGKYVLLLNADAFVGQQTLQKTYDFMEQNPDCGVVGCRLIGRDGQLQPSARYFPTPWRIFLANIGKTNPSISFLKGVDDMLQDHNRILECDWVPGCYLLTRKTVIDELDFFLRHELFFYYDDADFCLRVKKQGWKVIFYPEDVIHLGGGNAEKLAKLTEKGKQIATYNLEAGYIYFRHNYNWFYVLSNYLFIVFLASIRSLKNVLLFKKLDDVRASWGYVAMASSILIKTRFGKIPIH
ncbi:MAG: glycosyltransferase family 2 protein [Candidatus Parabeggiatoa sp. nov. 1]|nr:MAG: glycosyltransferase family 2 protein [Gammaproteobacteria bacterium]